MRDIKLLADTGGVKLGVRPIRIKGYYRALKRGEQWAIDISNQPPLPQIISLRFGPYLDRILDNESPLISGRSSYFKNNPPTWPMGGKIEFPFKIKKD